MADAPLNRRLTFPRERPSPVGADRAPAASNPAIAFSRSPRAGRAVWPSDRAVPR